MTGVEKLNDRERLTTHQPSDELVQLRQGQITLDEYLDARVEEATAHVKDLLSAEDLATVRDIVRGELRTDPVLVDLVRRATGHEPRP